jgi:hypothetical protein
MQSRGDHDRMPRTQRDPGFYPSSGTCRPHVAIIKIEHSPFALDMEDEGARRQEYRARVGALLFEGVSSPSAPRVNYR